MGFDIVIWQSNNSVMHRKLQYGKSVLRNHDKKLRFMILVMTNYKLKLLKNMTTNRQILTKEHCFFAAAEEEKPLPGIFSIKALYVLFCSWEFPHPTSNFVLDPVLLKWVFKDI